MDGNDTRRERGTGKGKGEGRTGKTGKTVAGVGGERGPTGIRLGRAPGSAAFIRLALPLAFALRCLPEPSVMKGEYLEYIEMDIGVCAATADARRPIVLFICRHSGVEILTASILLDGRKGAKSGDEHDSRLTTHDHSRI